jgi:aldose 1-epimerase
MTPTLHLLENAAWQVGILPQTGGPMAFGRIKHDGAWLDFFRPTSESDYDNPSKSASFPLIPWSNRIKDAHFRFLDKDYALQPNTPEGTAIHGVVRKLPCKVSEANSERIALHFDSSDYENVNFPFRFSAQIVYSVVGSDFIIETSLKNEDTQLMPGGFGHHPYFLRTLGSPDNAVSLEIPCGSQFRLVNQLAYEAPIPLADPHIDFRILRPLAPEQYDAITDDVLTHRCGDSPVRFVYPNGIEIQLVSDPIFKHIVLYAPKEKPFFAVEPVTNTNDGFNLYERGIPDTGVFILQPGQSQSGTIRLRIVKA